MGAYGDYEFSIPRARSCDAAIRKDQRRMDQIRKRHEAKQHLMRLLGVSEERAAKIVHEACDLPGEQYRFGLRADEVVVYRHPVSVNDDEREWLATELKAAFPQNQVLVIEGGARVWPEERGLADQLEAGRDANRDLFKAAILVLDAFADMGDEGTPSLPYPLFEAILKLRSAAYWIKQQQADVAPRGTA